MNENPYHQPAAEVAPLTGGLGLDLVNPRRRSFRRGGAWLFDAVLLFIKRPFAWVGATFLLWLLFAAMNLVLLAFPFVGSLVPVLLAPVFGAGLLQIAHTQTTTGSIDLGDLFAGFRVQVGPLIGLGGLLIAFMLGSMVVMVLLMFALFGADIIEAMAAADQGTESLEAVDPQSGAIRVGILFIVMFTAFLVIGCMYWFAPALVYFGGRNPLQALGQSLQAFLRNIMASVVYSVFVLVFWLLLMLVPLALMGAPALMAGAGLSSGSLEGALASLGLLAVAGGLLLVVVYFAFMAVIAISVYVAFRDIFLAEDPEGRGTV